MDVIVTWEDNTKNCVSTTELETIEKDGIITLGTKVKMLYNSKWYYGTVTVIENDIGNLEFVSQRSNISDSFSSEDTLPLSVIKKRQADDSLRLDINFNPDIDDDVTRCFSDCSEKQFHIIHASDPDNINHMPSPAQSPSVLLPQEQLLGCDEEILLNLESDVLGLQTCEYFLCKEEVFSSCFRCSVLLCWNHFQKDDATCAFHGKSHSNLETRCLLEEPYAVEGSSREFSLTNIKKVNKRKEAKFLRNTGQEYISPSTKKLVPAKKLGPRCNADYCKVMNRECCRFTDYVRQTLFNKFYAMESVTHQRDFLVRHMSVNEPKQRTVNDRPSKRKRSLNFYLTAEGVKYKVCRKLFLATFSISDKKVRLCLDKIDSSGILSTEKRGGRREVQKDRVNVMRQMILNHIQRFARVESHYCRSNTSREYLHPDLSVKKMHRLLISEIEETADKPGLTLYKNIFNSLNLSFHHPKKDQCSLCATYKNSANETKQQFADKYNCHTAEKKMVRALKDADKATATQDKSFSCTTFDLQQVIYLPITQEGAIFYKRQLSVYNLTVYNIASRECFCFTWPETESKRGSSEIATAVIMYLRKCDEAGIKRCQLYADGCAGQNKNSIMASALLHFINNSTNLHDVSVRFFVPNHGQNEGDSAHSAIQYALKKAGDVFLPVQLYPIMTMARPAQPYKIQPLEFQDFIHYKKLSQNIRVLSVRKDNETGSAINWTEVVEFRVQANNPYKISFKTSHFDCSYRSISVKRTDTHFLKESVSSLNDSKINIAKPKYEDLMSLCTGDTPIIRLQEYKDFYKNSPHD